MGYMGERKFDLDGRNLISCTEPCSEAHANLIENNKIKELGGIASTLRCIAPGAPQRGQKFNLPNGHMDNPKANRACTIYTIIDKNPAQE